MTRSSDSGHSGSRPALGVDLGTGSVEAVVTDLRGAHFGRAVGEHSVGTAARCSETDVHRGSGQ